MRPQGYDRRPRWRSAVLASQMHPMTKLVLLVTLDHMRANGKVCIDRATVAEALGIRHVQRISERWAQACSADFLTLVHKGSHGRPSTYEAQIPEVSSVRTTRTLGRPANPDTRESSKCPHGQVTTTRDPAQTQPRAAAGVPGTDRNAGMEEEQARTPRSIGRPSVDHLPNEGREERSA